MKDLFIKFWLQFNGYSLDYDGVYGGQCFDLIQAWSRDWLDCPAWITGDYAYQIYGQLPNFYNSIPNTSDAVPKVGDIVVWGKAYNGYAGHTGVATGSGDTGVFECFEQNDPTGSVCHIKLYDYAHVTGWLRKKGGVPSMANMYRMKSGKEVDIANPESNKVTANVYDEVMNQNLWVKKDKYDADIQALKDASHQINDPKADRLKAALKEFLS